jgi:hypothetical protein
MSNDSKKTSVRFQSPRDDLKKMAGGLKGGFQSLSDLFTDFQLEDKGGYITQEFQDFGYRLAVELNDLKHKSLYIKMAKNINRAVLESALSFIKDAQNAKSKAKLFMWKVQQLQAEINQKAEIKKKQS